MDEKLPPPQPQEPTYVFPGKERFIAAMIKEGHIEEKAKEMANERIIKAGYTINGDVVTRDG